MALDSAVYLVTREIAMRSGTINSRYRIADGRFVLSNKDLAMVRLTSDEYITGLQGVERISESDAQRLIAQNHFQRGLINASYVDDDVVQEQEQELQEQVEEQTEQHGDEEEQEQEQVVDDDNEQSADDTETETETPQDEPDVVDGEQVENGNNKQEQVEEE